MNAAYINALLQRATDIRAADKRTFDWFFRARSYQDVAKMVKGLDVDLDTWTREEWAESPFTECGEAYRLLLRVWEHREAMAYWSDPDV